METEIIELEQRALAVDEQAKAIIIKNQGQYDEANSFILNIKALQKKVKDTFGPIITKAFQAHKEAKAQETKHLEPLLKAEELIKGKMMGYLREQEAIRQEQERKLQAEAEKKRQEALAKAEVARANGQETKAEKYEEKASQIIAPQLATTVDRGNATVKKQWSAEVTDLMALVKAIAAGQAPITLIVANMPILNAQARALKDQMNYPGVKAVSEDIVAIRTV
jgi:hypothetical protein